MEETRAPEEQREYPDTLHRSVVDSIWKMAKDCNLFCTNDDEAAERCYDHRQTLMLKKLSK